jgi:hypothetical protein
MNTNNKQYIKTFDELSSLEKQIIKAHPENLVTAFAQGSRGIGKSLFIFKTGTHVFQFLEGLSLDDAYLRALDHFLWTTPQVLKAIDKVMLHTDYNNISKYDSENKYRFLAIDDVGTHMGKYKFYVDVGMVDDIKGRLDTIREVTCCLLMSAPALSGVLSFLRDYEDTKIIDITYNREGNTKYDRIFTIRFQKKKWARYGKLACPPLYGSIFVDDWAYDEYKARKRKALVDLFSSNKKNSRNDIIKAFQTIKKMNPTLKSEDIVNKLGLPDDILKIFKKKSITDLIEEMEETDDNMVPIV